MSISLKNIFICILACVALFGKSYAQDSLAVLVIGAGPAGLATAIEAHQAGASPLLIEKRFSCEPDRTLFLDSASLDLLEQWHVDVPGMQQIDVYPCHRTFMVQLHNLEKGLMNRVNELGINKLKGEFMGFMHDGIIVVTEHDGVLIHTDLLIGADGPRSRVREALGIFAGTFSSQEKKGLLVGEAAISTNCCQGFEANTAFKTAVLAGKCIQQLQAQDENAFSDFDHAMQELPH